MRREEPRALQRIGGHRHHTTGGGRRQIDAILRDAKQRQPRVWIASALARQPVGVLGVRQFSTQPVNFALLVAGAAGGIGSRLTESCEHAMRLVERV